MFGDSSDLDDLILRYLDGELNSDEVAKLESFLADSAEARQKFRELAEFEQKLHEHSELREKVTFLPDVQTAKALAPSGYSGVFRWVAAAVVLIGVWNFVEFQPKPPEVSPESELVLESIKPDSNKLVVVNVPEPPMGGGRNSSKGSVNQKPIPKEAAKIRYNQHIRPILSDKCFWCHGPDEETREADLRLDIREDALKAKAFVPGDADKSELVARILTDDKDDVMPPLDSHRELNEEEKQALIKWINAGAEYEEHWAYEQPRRDTTSSIDSLVSSSLKDKNLKMSPKADLKTLYRRLSFDLIGLPPKPHEVKDYVNDKSENATEKVIDRLLSSPHFGERMAVLWFDAVRYANTVGYHGDQARDGSPYRDYVINSFNANKPYDDFTIEQLAGDLIPGATQEQHVGASFSSLGQASEEGGIQDKEYIVKYRSERIRTTTSTWLGSTLGCAECHNHKFDPFTQKDFYQFGAFFADILEKGAWTGHGKFQETPNSYLDDYVTLDYKFISRRVTTPEQDKTLEELKKAVEQANHEVGKSEVAGLTEEFQKWKEKAVLTAQKKAQLERFIIDNPKVREHLQVKDMKTHRAHQKADAVYHGLVSYELTPKKWGQLNFHRYEQTFAADRDLAFFIKGSNTKQLQLKVKSGNNKWFHFAWGDEETLKDEKIIYMGKLPEMDNWHQLVVPAKHFESVYKQKLKNMQFLNNEGVLLVDGVAVLTNNKGLLEQTLGKDIYAELQKEKPNEAKLENHFRVYFSHILVPQKAKVDQAQKTLKAFKNNLPRTPATVSAKPRMVRILNRGNWMDETGEVVQPATPHFLPGKIESTDDKRLTRLDLAKWIASKENPLTARTFVNRLWFQFFGEGLSMSLDDLGSQGEWPKHPELLDWLAIEFMENDWDIKHLIKTIVMSDAYQQSSRATPALLKMDPDNRLLARQSHYRIEAEFVRDTALSISGLLNIQLGGKISKPYQPEGYYRHLNFPRRKYQSDKDENQYRRGVYMHWQRTFLHPMLRAFDAPSRDECSVKRPRSNTPVQSLVLLNDPTFVESARVFAEKVLKNTQGLDAQLQHAFETCLSRKPKAAELQVLKKLYQDELMTYKEIPDQAKQLQTVGLAKVDLQTDPVQLAAMTAVTRTLLNLHETTTRY
jgi:uncharacterized coiled-coil protein SlyX